MLRKLQALALVIRRYRVPILSGRSFAQTFECQSANSLSVLQKKGNIVCPNFQHCLAAWALLSTPTKSWIKEARIVDAKLTHDGVNGDHFCSMIRRDVQLLL